MMSTTINTIASGSIANETNTISRISKEDYESLVDKCYWLQLHLRNLDHQLNSCTFRLQSVQDQRLIKCWFALSLVELRRLINLVVRLMFELQTATMGRSYNTDYNKYALDQLSYFEFLWRCYFLERILKLNLQFRDYMTKHKQPTDSKASNERKKEDSLIKIMKDVQPTLENLNRASRLGADKTGDQTGDKIGDKVNDKVGDQTSDKIGDEAKDKTSSRKMKMPELDLFKESSTSIQLGSGEPSLEDGNLDEERYSDIGKSVDSVAARSKARMEAKTAAFLDSENRVAADLIALGQLEASMRVNQQLMECIRNQISMTKLTVQNIYDTGQRSLHMVERTSTNVQITEQISKFTSYARSLQKTLIILAILIIAFIVISQLIDVKNVFKKFKNFANFNNFNNFNFTLFGIK